MGGRSETPSGGGGGQRAESPISDIVEGELTNAGGIEIDMQDEGVRKVLEAARLSQQQLGAGSGGVKQERAEAGSSDDGSQTSSQQHEQREERGAEVKIRDFALTQQQQQEEEEVSEGQQRGAASTATPAPAPAADVNMDDTPTASAAATNANGNIDAQSSPVTLPPSSQPPTSPRMTITIRDPNGYKSFFKCKPSTPLARLFNTYADRFGLNLKLIRFVASHGQLNKADRLATLESAGFEDGDEIEVMLEQHGGAHHSTA